MELESRAVNPENWKKFEIQGICSSTCATHPFQYNCYTYAIQVYKINSSYDYLLKYLFGATSLFRSICF